MFLTVIPIPCWYCLLLLYVLYVCTCIYVFFCNFCCFSSITSWRIKIYIIYNFVYIILCNWSKYSSHLTGTDFIWCADGISPPDWKLNLQHQVALYNNSCHVTSLTNLCPYDRPRLLSNDFSERSSSVSQTFPTNCIVDEFFSSPWNGPATTSNLSLSQQPTESFQPTKYLPPPRQLPVTFDDVISARQLDEYYGNAGGVYPPTNHIAWYESPRELCQYEKNSISGSSFGTYQMTRNAATSLTVCPTSSSSWLSRQQEPSNKACVEYRMSRHHVVTDVTSARCGWPGGWDFDETMWQGKFVTPLQGL